MHEFHPTGDELKSISVLVHGLNVRPAAMNEILKLLQQSGSSVYLVKLSGHRDEGSEHMRQVTLDLWLSELFQVYQVARAHAEKEQVPLYYSGYSMGGAFGSYLMLMDRSVQFDKQVLFAPAHFIRLRSHVIKALFFLHDRRLLTSLTPTAYRANEFTSIGAYRAVFRMEQAFRRSDWEPLAIPTLIFMDEKDELISYPRLSKVVKAPAISEHYKLICITRKSPPSYHHLIIDPATAGEAHWSMIQEEFGRFIG